MTKRTNSPPANDPRRVWPGREEAASRLGVSVTTIRRMQRRGELAPLWVGGEWRFDPDDLADMLDDARTESAQREAAAEGAPAMPGDVLATTLREMGAHARASHAETRALIAPVSSSIDRCMRVLIEENAAKSARIAELENKLAESFEAREAALNDAAERDLARSAFISEQRQREKEQALKLEAMQRSMAVLARLAPAALQQLGVPVPAHLLEVPAAPPETSSPSAGPGPDDDDAAYATLLRLVRRIDDSALAALRNLGVTEDEARAIATLRAEMHAADAPTTEPRDGGQ